MNVAAYLALELLQPQLISVLTVAATWVTMMIAVVVLGGLVLAVASIRSHSAIRFTMHALRLDHGLRLATCTSVVFGLRPCCDDPLEMLNLFDEYIDHRSHIVDEDNVPQLQQSSLLLLVKLLRTAVSRFIFDLLSQCEVYVYDCDVHQVLLELLLVAVAAALIDHLRTIMIHCTMLLN